MRDPKSNELLSARCALLLCTLVAGFPLELHAQLRYANPSPTAQDSAARLEGDIQLGTALFEAGRFTEALPYLRRVWDSRSGSPEQESEARLLCEGEFGGALFQLGQYDEARPILTWVLGPLKQMHGLDQITAELSMMLGMLPGNEQSLPEAEPLLIDAYEFYTYIPAFATSENAASAARALGQLRYDQGRGAESEALGLESLHIVNKLRGNTVGLRVGALFVLGQAYGLEGRFKDAEANVLVAMSLLPNSPQRNAWMATSWEALGKIYERQAEWKRARHAYEQALLLRVADKGEQHWEVALIQCKLGIALLMLGDHDSAKPLLTQALHTREQHFGKDDIDTAIAAFYLGLVYGRQGHVAEADTFLTRAEKVFSETSSMDPGQVAQARVYLGELRALQQRLPEARELVQAAWGYYQTRPEMDYWRLHTAVTLASIEYSTGNGFQAQTLLQTTHPQLALLPESHTLDQIVAAALLGKLFRATGQNAQATPYEKEAARSCQGSQDPGIRRVCTSWEFKDGTDLSQPAGENDT